MEVAGRTVAKQMQMWINEEFAYITHKRDRGFSDLEEERRIRRELQLPEFNGRNPEGWIMELEDIFHFFQLDESAKLKAATMTLVGDAHRWFEWEHRRRPFHEWKELKALVWRYFGSTMTISWQSDLEKGKVVEKTNAVQPEEKKLLNVSVSQGFEIVKGLNRGSGAYLGGFTVAVGGEINGKPLLSNPRTRPESRKQAVKTTTNDFPQPHCNSPVFTNLYLKAYG
ncbi:hypothetical protein BVRB_5g108880 [Beta vulgaris subsp. vulgaris]|nr:hypothetical protein BVRB_5g108880 [Beta vulgaris subsp. vulgaris]